MVIQCMCKKNWNISCSSISFDKLRTDERFIAILNLARISNALLFCQIPALEVGKKNTPSAGRQLINSFLYASAILYEGLNRADSLGKYFKDLDSFKNGFAIILKDEKIKRHRNAVLDTLRNQFVFHFDKDIIPETLKDFVLPEYIFAISNGLKRKDIYYNLADEIVLDYLLRDIKDDQEKAKRFKEIIKQTTELMVSFSKATDDLIQEVLIEMGWVLKKF